MEAAEQAIPVICLNPPLPHGRRPLRLSPQGLSDGLNPPLPHGRRQLPDTTTQKSRQLKSTPPSREETCPNCGARMDEDA